jgi:hypothetical protein
MPTEKPPSAPKKDPPKKILPSSQYYTEENENDLTPENTNATEVNLNNLVTLVKKHGVGNKPLPSHPLLNMSVPKMKLPPHLKGGKKTRRRHKHTRRRSTRKH